MPRLTAEIIEGFAGVYLSPRYDQAQPTPDFHRECWTRYCSDAPACATAAPRNHAKSTALTHDYTLATVLFRDQDYVIIVGSSEEMAVEHLGDIANELRENEELRKAFLIKDFVTDQKTDIIVECTDGYQFRIIARGAEQKIRGRKWKGKRPGLIVFDDIEDDEQVESKDRRRKFRRWFFRACKQSLRDGGKIRGHGTILNEDSLLMHLMKNRTWASKLYKAHRSFSEFTDILWEEKFPVERLRGIRQEFIDEGDSAGYSQEYLNDPRDNDEAFLRKDDFLPMEDEDYEVWKIYGVGVDFAVSKEDTANRTCFIIGGKDITNKLHHVDCRVGRWNSPRIIEEFFSVEARWSPDAFWVEDGVIWKTIYPILQAEMQLRDTWLNCVPLPSTKDKKVRGRALQKRHRSGGCRYDKRAAWYPEYEYELLQFTGDSEALLDDQFDASTELARGMQEYKVEQDESDTLTDEELAFQKQSEEFRKQSGRSAVTGY